MTEVEASRTFLVKLWAQPDYNGSFCAASVEPEEGPDLVTVAVRVFPAESNEPVVTLKLSDAEAIELARGLVHAIKEEG